MTTVTRAPYRLALQPDLDAVRPDRVALRHGDVEVTFAELDERASRYASGLRAAGVRPGDRVVVAMAASPRLFDLLVGGARAGVVTVPVNVRLAARELAEVVQDAAPVVVVADEVLADRVPVVASEQLRLVVGSTYDAWLAEQEPGGATPSSPGDLEDVVLQIYTSGTSGRPKGVLLTAGNLAAKVDGVVDRWGMDGSSVSLLATPLFHVGAISWGLVGLAAGATTVLADDARPVTLLRHLREDRVTHAFLVPSMLGALSREAAGRPGPFPDLSTVVYGGSPISEQDRRAATVLLGPVLRQVYGMTETTGGFTELEPGLADDDPRSTSAGRAYPWVEVEVRAGEVWTHSAQNCAGYHRRPQDTSALVVDGWLCTGDLGRVDADGYLYVTGRRSAMVISGGENIHPAEVEAALRRVAGVADVVVYGEPDPTWGEAVVAAVVLDASDSPGPTPHDILEAARGEIAGYKRPRRIHLVDELPRNASGEVAVQELRARLGPPTKEAP